VRWHPIDRSSTPAWLLDELETAGRENLDAGHAARYDDKEEANAPAEVERLRRYLTGGGFLWCDDDYGIDTSFRRELERVLPGMPLVELPFNHPVFHQLYDFPRGLPKIHEHDGGPARAFAAFQDGRMVVFYSYDTDLGDGLEDAGVHPDAPEKRDQALRMGINIVLYAMGGSALP